MKFHFVWTINPWSFNAAAYTNLKSYKRCLTSNFGAVLREVITIMSSIFVQCRRIQKIKVRYADTIKKVCSTVKPKGET